MSGVSMFATFSARRRRPLSNLFLLVAAVVGLCWWVTGWAAPSAGEAGGAADVGDAPLTPISVQLQWRHQWQFAGFYAALEQGYYREAGLAVELREYAEGIDIIDAVVAGRADFGTYYSTVIAERMRGRPIRLLASYLKRSPLVLLVRPGLYSPADLKGLRVMANAQELGSANIRQMLRLGGLTESDLHVVPHSFSVEPFVRGEVDAMTAFTTNEPFYLHQRGVPFNVVDPSDYGIALYDLNLFAAADYAAAHPERMRAFVAATNRGWAYALAHPEDLVELILARYNTQGKERDHLRFEANQTHSAILPEVYPIGSIDPIQLNRIQDLFVATGLAAQTLPSADLVFDPEAAGSPPLPDAPLVLTAAERAAIAAHPRLRVVFAQIAPYALTRDGRPTGYTVELLARMAQLAGLELDWQEQGLGQTYRDLREGRADLTINSLVTSEREGFLNFSVRRYPVWFTIFARTDCTDCADLDALRDKTLATPAESELMRRLTRSHPELQHLPVAGYREALEAVAAGRADAAILERQNGRYLLAEHLIGGVEAKGAADLDDGRPPRQAALFAMRRDLEPLVGVLDKARDALGTGELQSIWDRWFHDTTVTTVPRPYQPPTLTRPEREFLAAHSKLRVVYTDAPPTATRRDGRHTGYTVELIERAAAVLGLTVELRQTSLVEAFAAVKQGRADLVLNAAQTPDRAADFRFGQRAIRVADDITDVVERNPANFGQSGWTSVSHFAVERHQEVLAALLDKAMDGLDPGEQQRLHARWFGADDPAVALRAQVHLTDAERLDIAARPDLVLGVDEDWSPLISRNPDGSFSGIDADTAALIDRVLGTRIRFELGPWAQQVSRAQQGLIDGLSASAVHPERAPHFLFTVPYAELGRRVFVKLGNALGLRRLEDLTGRRVAYLRGNLSDEKALAAVAGVRAVPVDSALTGANQVLAGDVDALLADDSFGYWLAERRIENIETAFVLPTPLPLVFSIRKDRPLLASAIDKVLIALSREQRQAIRNRYLGAPGAAAAPRTPVLSAAEQAYLDNKGGVLTYCFSPVWTPYDYLENGEHRGIFRDYLDLFARKLEIALRPLPSQTWREALEFARERRCDLISGAVPTPEREAYLAFTSPYVQLTHVLLARDEAPFVAGIESLAGLPIAVPGGTAVAANLKARYPQQQFIALDSVEQFQDAITSGRVYAAVATLEHAADLVEQGLGRFRIIAKLDDPYPIAVAVRNDQPELLAIMQKVVASTTPAERDQIARRRTTFRIEQDLDLSRLWQFLGLFAVVGAFLGWRHWELTRLNRHLRRAKEAAELANRAKGDFLANMSHEIRTPLNAVLNLAALGVRTQEPTRLRDYLTGIERAGRSLLAVVNEILDFSRLEGGADTPRDAPFQLQELVDEVLSIAAPLAAEKGLALECVVDPDLDGAWSGDAHKIERVLINLIANAVKFTDQGRVTLRVGADGTASGGERVMFTVEDTGIGIAADQLPTLFTPFNQGDNSLARRHGGTGLGLAIVKQLTGLMNGEVGVDSRPGAGARFTVVIPLRRGPASPGAVAGGEQAAGAPSAAGGGVPVTAVPVRPVLVVEDNLVNQRIVVEFLSQLGIAAEPVADGETALDRLRQAPTGYALVLMDIQMPGMDGYETTRRLRADPRLRDLPVIAITAHVLTSDQQRCQAAGMNDHIPKPFDQAVFAATLARWMTLPTAPVARPAATGQAPPADGSLDAAGATALPERPWIDAAAGVRRVGGDPDLYLSLLGDFLSGYGPRLETLVPEAAERGGDTLSRLAHMLRGTAPVLGAERVAELAAAAAVRCQPGTSAAAAYIAELHTALARTLDAARTIEAAGLAGLGQPLPTPTPAAPRRSATGEGGALVLIVDDDPLAAGLLLQLLGEEYRAATADTGDAALALARGRPRPDLILLDVMMAGMDGYQVCRALKADPGTRDIPVIFVSGRGGAENESQGLELGAVDYVHKPFDAQVVLARVRNHLAAKRQGDSLARLSELDALTGLANRRRLDAYLAEQWQWAISNDAWLGLLMMDVDHFKAYNDCYGHGAGDQCLCQVATALRRAHRREEGLVARYGGEEFVRVMPGADLAAARAAAARSLEAVRAAAIPHQAAPGRGIVTLSIGVWACRPQPDDRLDDCLAQADRRLYQAKSEGRDRFAA